MDRGNKNSGDRSFFPLCVGVGASLAGGPGNSDVHSLGKGKRLLLPLELRVWVYTEFTPDCWIWRAGRTPDGYGKICETLPGSLQRFRLVHVLVYRWTLGEIPAGNRLDHVCRNRACLNPSHLEPVTNAVNCQRGIAAKLNPTSVLEIRQLRSEGSSQMDLARKYGVDHKTIQKILSGESWRNVVAGEAVAS